MAWAAASKLLNRLAALPPAAWATISSVSGLMLTVALLPLPSATECSTLPSAPVTLTMQGNAPPDTLTV